MIDEELRPPLEQVRQRRAPLIGREAILFVEADPRQSLTLPRELVAAPRQLLFRLQQLQPRGQPLLTRPGDVFRHRKPRLSRRWISRPAAALAFSKRSICAMQFGWAAMLYGRPSVE